MMSDKGKREMAEECNADKVKPKIDWHLVKWAVAVVVGLWLALGVFAWTRAEPGQFGDMFGAVNALFSGLAFAGIIVAIWTQSHELALQREQLALQRTELTLTREEMRGQKEQLAAQDRTMQKQAFESTFFALSRRFREMAESLQISDPAEAADSGTRAAGRAYWRIVFQELDWDGKFEAGDANKQLATYLLLYRAHESGLAPCFAMLAETIAFLERSDFGHDPTYARLLRAQLFPEETFLIALHGLSPDAPQSLKGQIERLGLLKLLPKHEEYPGIKVFAAYASSAFEDPPVPAALGAAGEVRARFVGRAMSA